LVEKIIKGKNEVFWALQDVNLTIMQGERIGVIGPNGSGKTTLLKIIAGIATPTQGTISTHGRVVSLIDLEAGFHPDLTGEQNIYLNGLLLQMSRKDIQKMLPEIIHFADIGRFIDTPMYTYSDGMKLRLGFSVAVHTKPDILIMDENFAVGDETFLKKAIEKIFELQKQKITIIMASHWIDFLKQNCTRIIKIEKGIVMPSK